MREVKSWVGSELFHGAVYGLGMSFAVWIPLNSGTLTDGLTPLFCLVAALAGVSRSWAGWPAPAALPWILAAWQLDGAGSALLIAVLAAAGARWTGPNRRSTARLAFDVGAAAIALVVADILARLTPASGALAAFSFVFVVLLVALHGLRSLLEGNAGSEVVRPWTTTLLIAVASIGIAWGIAAVWNRPELRPWLAIVPALRLGAMIGSHGWSHRRKHDRRRRSMTPDRLRDRTAEALARQLPEGAEGGHLWRTEALCRALAERLGCDPVELRRLRQAALMHHAGQLVYDDASIDVHPRVLETTVEHLGFSSEMRAVLVESREHWDGSGRQGLRGERIARGARILAVADRYDQLTHPAHGSVRSHAEAMNALRREPSERFDPLMFEILDELGERLEATGGDLTRAAAPPATPGPTRLVHGERDLQTLYSIERAIDLPIGLRERMTLIAGLLRTMTPFERMILEPESGEAFRYGAHDTEAAERILELRHGGRLLGRLHLALDEDGDDDPAVTERLNRVASMLASMLAAHEEAAPDAMTDPATGLPNAGYLRRILARRIPEAGQAGPGFGLIALHLNGLDETTEGLGRDDADRLLQTVAQRLAGACEQRETLVRLGPDQFILVTGESRGGELVRRWHVLVDDATAAPIRLGGRDVRIHLDASHASHPIDGERLNDLLATLESRLSGTSRAAVLPFRTTRAG